jgi:hypothetical protein
MTPVMKMSMIGIFMVIISLIIFILNYFEVPMTLYMPYIYWIIAILIFTLILPSKSNSVFDEPS